MTTRSIPLALLMMVSNAFAIDAAQLMDDLIWEKRVLVIFSPGGDDPNLQLQDAALGAEQDGLVERHMTVIHILADNVVSIDGKPQVGSGEHFHEHFGVTKDEFRVLLIGKDGGVKLDRDRPVSVGELFSLIDSMPMRRYEMQQNG